MFGFSSTPTPMESPHPPRIDHQHSPQGSDKLWAIFCHLSSLLGVGIILPVVVYLVMRRESRYVGENAREALNFHISVFLYSLCCLPLAFFLIGIPLLAVIGIAAVVLAIIAAIKASEGTVYRYPLTLRLVS